MLTSFRISRSVVEYLHVDEVHPASVLLLHGLYHFNLRATGGRGAEGWRGEDHDQGLSPHQGFGNGHGVKLGVGRLGSGQLRQAAHVIGGLVLRGESEGPDGRRSALLLDLEDSLSVPDGAVRAGGAHHDSPRTSPVQVSHGGVDSDTRKWPATKPGNAGAPGLTIQGLAGAVGGNLDLVCADVGEVLLQQGEGQPIGAYAQV